MDFEPSNSPNSIGNRSSVRPWIGFALPPSFVLPLNRNAGTFALDEPETPAITDIRNIEFAALLDPRRERIREVDEETNVVLRCQRSLQRLHSTGEYPLR